MDGNITLAAAGGALLIVGLGFAVATGQVDKRGDRLARNIGTVLTLGCCFVGALLIRGALNVG